jgi:hypothetical protein
LLDHTKPNPAKALCDSRLCETSGRWLRRTRTRLRCSILSSCRSPARGSARGRPWNLAGGLGAAAFRWLCTRCPHNRPRQCRDEGVRFRGTARRDGKPRSETHRGVREAKRRHSVGKATPRPGANHLVPWCEAAPEARRSSLTRLRGAAACGNEPRRNPRRSFDLVSFVRARSRRGTQLHG